MIFIKLLWNDFNYNNYFRYIHDLLHYIVTLYNVINNNNINYLNDYQKNLYRYLIIIIKYPCTLLSWPVNKFLRVKFILNNIESCKKLSANRMKVWTTYKNYVEKSSVVNKKINDAHMKSFKTSWNKTWNKYNGCGIWKQSTLTISYS